MLRRRATLLIVLTAVVTLTACGGSGDADSAAPSDAPTTGPTADATTPAPEPTPTAEPAEPAEPAAEIVVDVQPFDGEFQEGTEAMHAVYTEFETALWASLAAGEITDDLRALAGPDVVTGLEQAVSDQPKPLGGTVAVTSTLEDVTLMQLGGGGPTVTEAVLTGCSDQTQVEYEAGTGRQSAISARIGFVDGAFLVEEYILGTEAC